MKGWALMAKKICVLCGQQIGVLKRKIDISDGYVCADCLLRSGINSFENHLAFSSASLQAFARRKNSLLQLFTPTKKIGSYLSVDSVHKTFKIDHDLFEFKNLLSFELIENGQTIQKGGLGRAVVGGAIFGGAGAAVGAITGRKVNNICTSLMIHLTLKNAQTDVKRIVILPNNSQFKVGSMVYNAAQINAQNCLSALQVISDTNDSENFVVHIPDQPQSPALSAADEIMQFKALADGGVITQEEFETKKKQLLGL